jgi:hypothetical protein
MCSCFSRKARELPGGKSAQYTICNIDVLSMFGKGTGMNLPSAVPRATTKFYFYVRKTPDFFVSFVVLQRTDDGGVNAAGENVAPSHICCSVKNLALETAKQASSAVPPCISRACTEDQSHSKHSKRRDHKCIPFCIWSVSYFLFS